MHRTDPGRPLRRSHRCNPLRSSAVTIRRAAAVCLLLVAPTILLGPALQAERALLPADLLVQFDPWRSYVAQAPHAYWDPLVWDGIAQYYPWRHFAAESLRGGYLPLWNPYQLCGTPFLANGQSAVLYPLNLLFWLLPVYKAFAWSAWLHLVLAGLFAYLFLRVVRVGRFGAAAAAVIWQINSFFVAWIHLPTIVCTAAWLPLILLSCDRALLTGRGRWALAAGAAAALSYLGGHPQAFMLVALLTGCYVVARGLSREIKLPPRARLLRILATALVLGVSTVGLAAAQLLPTLDFLRIAHRTFVAGPDSYRAFLSHAVPVARLGGLLSPHAFGHPALGTHLGIASYAEYCLYLGIVALGLGVWAIIACRTWHARFFACAAVIAILVATGTPANWPLYHWVPGMARAGGPSRALLLAVFSLSMLGGIGAESALRRLSTRRRASQAAPVLVLALTAQAAWLWWYLGGEALTQLQPAIGPLARTEIVRAAVLVAAAVGCLLLARVALLHRIGQVGLLAVLMVDLLLAAQHHVHVVPSEWVYPAAVGPEVGEGRVLGNAADWPVNRFPRAVLPPNAATVYRARDAFGYDSLYLARYRDFASLIQGGDPSPALNGNLLLPRLGPVYGLDMMRLAGITTVLSPVRLRWLELEKAGTYYTYTDSQAYPRAWVTDSAIAVPSHRQAQSALLHLGPRRDCLIITGPAPEIPAPISGTGATARVRDVSPNEVRVEMSEGGGYLFLADSYAPGWRAYAENRELRISIADLAFRAVAPPRGSRSVIFRYEPASFRVGVFVTLATLACACAAGGWAAARRGRGP